MALGSGLPVLGFLGGWCVCKKSFFSGLRAQGLQLFRAEGL